MLNTAPPVAAASSDVGLDMLPNHQSAQVVRLLGLDDASRHELVLRLLEIGFLPGEPVRVMARGFPGGDPLAVRVGHTTFALRRHEAALVRVQVSAGGTQ